MSSGHININNINIIFLRF